MKLTATSRSRGFAHPTSIGSCHFTDVLQPLPSAPFDFVQGKPRPRITVDTRLVEDSSRRITEPGAFGWSRLMSSRRNNPVSRETERSVYSYQAQSQQIEVTQIEHKCITDHTR